MQFVFVRNFSSQQSRLRDTCIFTVNDWDDFGFKTSLEAKYFDFQGRQFDLGYLRLAVKGMKPGYVLLPESGALLGDEYYSLGNDEKYYRQIFHLPMDVAKQYLLGVRDIVSDPKIYEIYAEEEAMRASLLRFSSYQDVMVNYPAALKGNAKNTNYSFSYTAFTPGSELELNFDVEPNSPLPTNIHVLIGRNGVGKTRLLAGMCDALTKTDKSKFALAGKFDFKENLFSQEANSQFLNLVVVSFSVFDRFDPVAEDYQRREDSIPYNYVGIKQRKQSSWGKEEPSTTKTTENLVEEFEYSLRNVIANIETRRLWLEVIGTLKSDPQLADHLNEEEISGNFIEFGRVGIRLVDTFNQMSSGHKIVLLTLVRLVESVREQSLVILDEPETHLHPPLLGSMIRALSNLLKSRNAVAIVATHSPVVLQEVPRSCVNIISKSGEMLVVNRPEDETFAENVGVLTRRVFHLELEQSGFYSLLTNAIAGNDYSTVMSNLNEQVGGEGRALVRSLTTKAE